MAYWEVFLSEEVMGCAGNWWSHHRWRHGYGSKGQGLWWDTVDDGGWSWWSWRSFPPTWFYDSANYFWLNLSLPMPCSKLNSKLSNIAKYILFLLSLQISLNNLICSASAASWTGGILCSVPTFWIISLMTSLLYH